MSWHMPPDHRLYEAEIKVAISSMSCGHTEWTRVSRQDKDRLLVRQSGRLKALVSQLPHPETQTPSLVLTCRPLRQQRGTRKRSAAAACGTVHVDLEPHTIASPNPVFLATSFLSPTNATSLRTHGQPRITPPRRCCFIMSETSISLEPHLARANAHIQILFPYIDVILLPVLQPTVSGSAHAAVCCLAFCSFDPGQVPAGSRTLGHPHWPQTLVNASLQRDQPFPRYVELSRTARPVAPDLFQHLGNFIALLDQGQKLGEFATDAIAASLFPRSLLTRHARAAASRLTLNLAFPPRRMFHDLHRDACSEALRIGNKTTAQTKTETGNSTGTVDSDTFLESIVARIDELHRSGEPAVALHAKSYRKYQDQWLSLRTRNTCLLCIRRVPQYELRCGHSICEHCVRVFGHASEEGPRFFAVPPCFLCGAYAGLHMRVRPPTAGVGVLCIDGGGVRGIIPTTILELLEEEHFQLCAGVCAGALALSTLFLNGWTAAKFSRAFEAFATTVFRRGQLAGLPGISQLWTVVNNALDDSLPLEVTLKAIFDATTSMTAPSYASTIGAKLALVVAPTWTPVPLLITNVDWPPLPARKSLLANRDRLRRAYFAPMHINSIGLLQDAGVIQNNPINLALSELRSLYPAKSLPQYLISLATGIERASRERVPGKRSGFFKRHFLYRLFRAYMSLLSGKKTKDDFDRSTKTSPVFERCIRLDANVLGPAAPLDDAGSVPGLKRSVHQDRLLQDALAKRIVASLFYLS
ncbi:hypothetical protein BKA56DRAFT_737905 [Ilyonectria sp. MPI-CAGE-AT-0026]|nr:hypothetical protein BKA56DRAFT_737905 [Ilyonectria sp. MPI-CAGE-AT-0026]